MRRRRSWLAPAAALLVGAGVALAAVAVFSGGGGGSGSGSNGGKLHGTITLGLLVPTSGGGDFSRRARDLTHGAELAAAQVNRDGGVLGHRVGLAVVDDGGCAPAVAYEAAKSLAEGSGVAAVLGGTCDAAAAKEVPVLDAAGIPFLVTTANGDDLIDPDVTSAFLLNGTVYQQALSATYWMNYRASQRLAIVEDMSPESQALGKNAIHLLDQAPRLVSLQRVPVGQTPMRTVAKAALASHPDFVLWTGSAAGGGALAGALNRMGYNGTFTATAASYSPSFLAAAGKGGADGAFVTATSEPRNMPNAAAWRARFAAAYHTRPGLDAMQAFDAVRAFAQATRQAGTIDGPSVTAKLTKLPDTFTTFMGPLRFAPDHTLLYDNRVILVVRHGAFAWKRSLRTDALR